jgi:hypothetical protein
MQLRFYDRSDNTLERLHFQNFQWIPIHHYQLNSSSLTQSPNIYQQDHRICRQTSQYFYRKKVHSMCLIHPDLILLRSP